MANAIIKNNIQKYRVAKGNTQEEVAQSLGIIRTYLSKLENQKFSPGPELMMKICNYFGVELGDMFYIERG